MRRFSIVFAALLFVYEASGHGYMTDPPSRSSLWRFGYNAPPNYNDMELFCGGYGIQWEANNGKCGECGDRYDLPRPRPNEAGGLYGLGIITENYKQGEVVTITVNLTANHLGYFEFRLCPTNDPSKLVTQDCLDQHLLEIADGSGTKYYLPNSNKGATYVDVKLPVGLTCSQCVLQWKYVTATRWGACGDGTSASGCGPQETFQNCGDVSIS